MTIREIIDENTYTLTVNTELDESCIESVRFQKLEEDLQEYFDEQMLAFLNWGIKNKPIAKNQSELLQQFKNRKND